MDMSKIMEGVTEYAEGLDVSLNVRNGRLVIEAKNEAGHNGTNVDLVQVLLWVQKNLPELLYQPWVGLTNDEISATSKGHIVRSTYARAIEAKLKEKNT